jgi:hypothetical protein
MERIFSAYDDTMDMTILLSLEKTSARYSA